MVWSAPTLGRIAMAREDNLRAKLLSTANGSIEVLDFKPQLHPVPISQIRISDRPVVVFNFPTVQLHEQLAIGNQLLVVRSAVAALASQQPLVPATARFDIPNANHGLWAHMW